MPRLARTSKPSAFRTQRCAKCKGKPKPARKRPGRATGHSARHRNFKCRQAYHIFQRGNDGRKVFLSDDERIAYLEHLFFLAGRYNVKVHNFCLMPTHVHLVLEQRQVGGISDLMRELQSTHTRCQNKRRNSYGNLWTQHFGCKHVSTDAYYRTLMWYLGNNPVKTGAVAKAADYLWSGAQILAKGGPVTLEFKGREIKLSLHMERYEKACKSDEWQQTLAEGNIEKVMAEEIKQVELILDGKALRAFANAEAVRKRNEKKAQQRQAKLARQRLGVGAALQAEAAAKAKTKKAGKGAPSSMRAG